MAHIRFSPSQFEAVKAVAHAANMTMSAFVRSLAIEGAGVRPFLGAGDREVLNLLADAMRTISGNLNQIARAINTGRVPDEESLSGSVKDAQVVAMILAAELAEMARRSSALRRGDGD